MTDRNREFFGAESPVVLQMLLDEIKQARLTLTAHQQETREEFRRIHDKIDGLRNEVRSDFQDHDRDIVKLTTQARLAGRMSGFIAGAAATAAINGIVFLIKWLVST